MDTMEVDGQCLCGYVTYEAIVDPATVVVCNCTQCQTLSGSAFSVSVGVVDEQLRLLSGELKHYEKTAESGAIRAMAFCPECGSRLYGKAVGEGIRRMSLRVGHVNQRAQLRPRLRIWCRSEQPWIDDLGEMPKIDRQPSLDDLARLGED